MEPARSLSHYLLETICALGGGVFRGVQEGMPQLGLDALVLFDDASAPKEQRSTMAVRSGEISAERVRSEIARQRETYARFEQFAEKAAVRVFRQFSCGGTQ